MTEIPKAYEPKAVEEKWYQFWCDQGCFTANPDSPKPAYAIVIPPPNVTGMLHMGHVLNNTIQDILARKARMDGKEVLWLPGTDHAGIATQTVVENTLRKQGVMKHRDDLGRDKFLEHVWAWKEKHGGIIIQQLRKLGCSCDWTRERFTMDPEYSRCVQKVFVELYKKGLIYRGKRMVNWDPKARTALSDEEVEMIEEKGHLWHLKYPLLDERGQPKADEFVVVATTRPETMLGDEAVAVNPGDPRYRAIVGRKCLLPLQNKPIPIIADDFVDPKFGTGCVKVTPAHDPNDYAMALRHNLPLTVVIGPDGCMTAAAGEDFDGLDRMEARKAVVEELTEQGLLLKIEEYTHNVGYSQRSHVPVEPYLSEQWFLKYPSVEQALACVVGSARVPRADSGVAPESSSNQSKMDERTSGETPDAASGTDALPLMRFHPERWTKTYAHWMTNLRDWCISRQLWWGHRVPVWTMSYPEERDAVVSADILRENGAMIAVRTEGNTVYAATAVETLQDLLNKTGWEQDPDVLDTWFSSWLWPFATMGWPEQTPTLKKFYPTTDLVTGPDIIFFWVARMIMAGYEFMGDLPFRNVYFTGIIRDKLGRKMSKSLGNSPDPLDLIAKYGADALRFGTMRSAPLGQDVLFDEKDVELGRNFCNKLWNACRFRQLVGQASSLSSSAGFQPAGSGSASTDANRLEACSTTTGRDACATFPVQAEMIPERLTSDDKWILLRLDQAIRDITTAFAEYKFNEATTALYRFFWSEFCDWYLEAAKAALIKPTSETAPSPLNGESARVSGENAQGFPSSLATSVSDRPASASASEDHRTASPLTPALSPLRGEGEARRVNTLAVLDFVLSHTLRLFHPFLPFITEELWHGMGYSQDMPENQGGKTIMFAPWPKPLEQDFRDHYGLDDCYLEYAEAKQELVVQGRNLRREYNVPSNKRVKFILKPAAGITPHDQAVLKLLLNAESLEINADFAAPKGMPRAHAKLGEIYLPLEGLIDVTAERARLTKELEKASAEVAKAQDKLNNPAFVQKVPAHVLQEHQRRLAEWQGKRDQLQKALDGLAGA